MAQASTDQRSIPTANSGMGPIVSDIQAMFDALFTSNAGNTAPPEPVKGMPWLDTSATPHVVRIYGGASWGAVGTVDPTSGVFQPAARTMPANTFPGRLATAGPMQDLTAAQLIAGLGLFDEIVDTAFASYAVKTSISTVIPIDGTSPQSNEGTAILSVSMTPKAATNRYRARSTIMVGNPAGASSIAAVAAIFDSVAGGTNALNASIQYVGGDLYGMLVLEMEWAAGSTAARTISVRVGATSGMFINRYTGSANTFGASGPISTLTVEEIRA